MYHLCRPRGEWVGRLDRGLTRTGYYRAGPPGQFVRLEVEADAAVEGAAGAVLGGAYADAGAGAELVDLV